MTSVLEKDGSAQSAEDVILEVLAHCKEDLYKSRCIIQSEDSLHLSTQQDVLTISEKEVSDHSKELKINKAAHASGAVAEVLKVGGEQLVWLLAEIFDDVLQGSSEVPTH